MSEKTNKIENKYIIMIYCCSVTKLCPTLCDRMDYSMLGFPVLHYLPKSAQVHIH